MILIILLSLAAFRITYMLVEQDGPFDMFVRLRHLASKQPEGKMLFNFDCFDCLSVWVSGVLVLCTTRNIIDFLAVAAIAMLIYRVNRRI